MNQRVLSISQMMVLARALAMGRVLALVLGRVLGRVLGLVLVLALWSVATDPAHATPSADEAAIRASMAATWDRPEQRLVIDPVVVAGRHAVAGWTQGERGGRALLQRNAHGQWEVTVCAGDGLKELTTLQQSGVDEPSARQLLKALADAEAKLPASRLAQFASFEGLLRMGASGHHGHHGPAASAAQH